MKFLLLLWLVFVIAPAGAETSLWEVSRDGQRLFIGGTIHVLGKEDFPLPEAYDLAYAQSDHLFFETDVGHVNSPEFSGLLQQQLTYTNGNSLKDILQPATYSQLEKYCKQAGIPVMMLLPFKPPLVSMMLTVLELKRIGIDSTGVDQYYHLKAKRDGKSISQLETVDEQLRFLANMASGHEDELILSTLKENRQLGSMMHTMLGAWREGDQQLLEDTFIKPMKKDFPSIYQLLLVDRNNNWYPVIRELLTTREIEFVLVGALHLVGKNGIIERLRRNGYEVKQW